MNHKLESRTNNILSVLRNIKNGANNHQIAQYETLLVNYLQYKEWQSLERVISQAENYAADAVTKRVWWKR